MPMHPICPCLAPGEPITQIGLYDRTMEAAPMHVLGNPTRSVTVSRYPNCIASFNDIDAPCLDLIRTRCIDIFGLTANIFWD